MIKAKIIIGALLLFAGVKVGIAAVYNPVTQTGQISLPSLPGLLGAIILITAGVWLMVKRSRIERVRRK